MLQWQNDDEVRLVEDILGTEEGVIATGVAGHPRLLDLCLFLASV